MKEQTFKRSVLLSRLKDIILEKITLYEAQLNSLVQSRDNETKSSVGDKFETTRALLQSEIGKVKNQLAIVKNDLLLVKTIPQSNFTKTADFGSIVITDQNTYFLSIGIGKLLFEENNVYCISMQAPLSKSLIGKQEGETCTFNGKEYEIIQIL